ncbi:hypothetical protein B0H14DRAFT_3857556, partial [Mycena olivaceomarginata]
MERRRVDGRIQAFSPVHSPTAQPRYSQSLIAPHCRLDWQFCGHVAPPFFPSFYPSLFPIPPRFAPSLHTLPSIFPTTSPPSLVLVFPFLLPHLTLFETTGQSHTARVPPRCPAGASPARTTSPRIALGAHEPCPPFHIPQPSPFDDLCARATPARARLLSPAPSPCSLFDSTNDTA